MICNLQLCTTVDQSVDNTDTQHENDFGVAFDKVGNILVILNKAKF